MSQYRYREPVTDEKRIRNTPIHHWFDQNDILEPSRQNVDMFNKLVEANRNNNRCRFTAYEEYSDIYQNRKGVSIGFYRNGSPINFEIPSEPCNVRATVLEDKNVKVEWLKPQFGGEHIKKYQIYGRNNANPQWTLLSTTNDATESAIISNLDGTYQFKIQGITDYVVTPESNISNTTGEYSLSMMKKISTGNTIS